MMSIPTEQSVGKRNVRRDAEDQLRDGTATSTHGGVLSPDALSLLHRLASDPASAGDALKLLHELQVHQVELDLQHRQIETNEQQLDGQLTHYKTLFEFAPMAYFVLTLNGDVVEANAEAATLLKKPRGEMHRRRITDLVSPDSQLALAGVMKRLNGGAARTDCQIRLSDTDDTSDTLHLSASVAPDGAAILAVLSGQARS